MMQVRPDSPLRHPMRFGRRTMRLLLAYTLVWFILAGAEPSSWIIGIPAVLLAVAVSLFLSPGPGLSLSLAGLLLFIPFFIVQSVMSGVDVMRRTFSPVPRIRPGMVAYRTTLEGSGRILLANVISLQPGTLSADLREETILIHVLDTEMPVEENIRALERRIARIFPHRSVPEESA
ncbi:MAG TPA: cation transporter [Desulfobacteraceae bacterium]|nr:cation transporter [Desulfobacteraceae bacterium]